MSYGNRNDFGQSKPIDRLTRPRTDYPTTNVESLVMVEDVLVTADFVPLYYGQARDDASNLKLVAQKEIEGDGGKQYMRRVWATDRNAQDAEALAVKYTSDHHSYPVFIRRYILPDPVTPLTEGTALTAVIGISIAGGGSGYASAPTLSFSGGGGSGAAAKCQIRDGVVVGIQMTASGSGYTSAPTVTPSSGSATFTASIQPQTALLVSQEQKPAEGEIGSLYSEVTRVWMTLPGPAITTTRLDDDGDVVTITRTDKAIASITSDETVAGGIWTKTTKGEGNVVYATEISETRALPGTAIVKTQVEEDGMTRTISRRRRALADITVSEAVAAGTYTKVSMQEITELVGWEITETRPLPGNTVTAYAVDGETGTNAKIDTQLIEDPGAPLTQGVGTAAVCTLVFSGQPSDGDIITLPLNDGTPIYYEFDNYVVGVASSGGVITFSGAANEGDYLVLTTHDGTAFTFEFDSDDSITFGRIAVQIGASATAQASNFAAAVAATLLFTATKTSNTVVTMARVDVGASNQTITGLSGTAQVEAVSTSGTITVAVPQVETGTVIGTIDPAGAGDAQVVVTAAGMTGSPITINNIAVANNDTASQVATAIRAALNLNANVTAWFSIGGTGADVVLTRLAGAADDATMNIAIDNNTCTGLTAAPTSADTTAGVAAGTGNAKCIVTAAGMSNSPKTVTFAVVAGDTASVVGGKLRTALTADADVNGFFVVSGATIQAILTARTIAANDATMEMEVSNDTCTGISTTTSADSIPGVAPAYVITTSFSSGVNESAITEGNNRIAIGASVALTVAAVDAALDTLGYFTGVASLGTTVVISRVGTGNQNLTTAKSGTGSGNFTLSNFSGGADLAAAVEYHPISKVHGKKVTTSLPNYWALGRTHYETINYTFPKLIYGITYFAPKFDNGQVRVAMNWSARAARQASVLTTTYVTYGPRGTLGYITPFRAVTKDLSFNGLFINVHQPNVLNNYMRIRFNTASDNPIWGYIVEECYFLPSGTSASTYASLIGRVVCIDCDIKPWGKYNLDRRVARYITLQ